MNEPRLVATPRLSEVLDVRVLADVCRSFAETFGAGLSVESSEGRVLASAAAPDAGGSSEECTLPLHYDGARLGQVRLRGARTAPGLDALAQHAVCIVEALTFSGHRAHLASTMHLAASDASFRELSAQNEQLKQAYGKLKQLDQLKSNFLATMSHELRTPLTSIIGYSEMLGSGMGGELNPTQHEFVDTIRAKGDHLLELILTLLDVAKLEQSQVKLQRVAIDPVALAQDVVRTVSPTAAKKHIELSSHCAPALARVHADPGRLRQVLLNLVENAIKFTPANGRVSLEVEPATLAPPMEEDAPGMVLLGAPEPAVQFTVRDTGIGIAESEHERIFDAFYQVDGSATREYGGTGLGLSIVKRLVDAHDGAIELDSRLGAGTTFRVRIPVAEE